MASIVEQLESKLRIARVELRSARRELASSKEALAVANEELRSANEELRSRAEQLDAVRAEVQSYYASSQIATVFLDRELRIARSTPAASQLLHIRASDGRPISDLAPRLKHDLLPDIRAALRTGTTVERNIYQPDGRAWFAARIAPCQIAQNEVKEVVVTFVDITSLKRAEEAVRESEERLREADRQKNQFLSALSHELRNPLAPIRNSLFILNRAPPGGEQARRAQAIIDRQVGHLTKLIDELLDVTRISRGKIQLQLERVDLSHLVRRTIEDHRPVFAAQGIELTVAIAPGELPVNGDRTRLTQAVGNLLQNAAKFTSHGGRVWISLERDAQAAEGIIKVRDTGMGIQPEMLARLFEPFAQADNSLARSMGGLGLGLALVKGLIEMHGGTASACSEGPGRGAEFMIRLPLCVPAAAPRVKAQEARSRGCCRVLIIEDNVDAASSLQEALELKGHEVEVAFNGREGVNKARRLKPEVVLCDIGLPEMDGYAVARALRADKACHAIRLIALSGYALPEDLARSREAGFDHHLAKPLRLDALAQFISELPEEKEASRTSGRNRDVEVSS